MKVLVTGGTGFIGSHLAQKLVSDGLEVLITGSDPRQKLPWFTGKCLTPGLSGIDYSRIGKLDVLYHQAAINDTQYMDAAEMFMANVVGTRKLFQHVLENGCRKIVFASSTAIYGTVPAPHKEDGHIHPNNAYAKSKLAVELMTRELNALYPDAVFVGLRYCNVYGARENKKGKRASMIGQLIQQMMQGNPKLFEYGEQKRDYVYVKDVVWANQLASQAQESCVVNVGTGDATTFNDLIAILNSILGVQRIPEYIKNPFGSNYQSHTQCSTELAKEKIAFEAQFDIQRGIADYYQEGMF